MPARGARTYQVYARSISLRSRVHEMQSPAIDVAGSYALRFYRNYRQLLPRSSCAILERKYFIEYQSFNQSRRSAVHFTV